VPAMKVNISAAMRARDVSRPREEQVAEAEAAEAKIPSAPRANVTAAGSARGDEARDAAQGSTGRRSAARDDEWRTWDSEPERDGRDGAPTDRKGRAEGTRRRRMPQESPRRG